MALGSRSSIYTNLQSERTEEKSISKCDNPLASNQHQFIFGGNHPNIPNTEHTASIKNCKILFTL